MLFSVMRFSLCSIFAFIFTPLLGAYDAPAIPYAPAAGLEGSTAIAHDNAGILAWASGVTEVQFGSDVADSDVWKDPAKALGPAGDSNPSVLVLGRGGSVTLAVVPAIQDGEGNDFAVFENGFSDTFLELAYVEVSTDGVHFVRFPNYSLTADPVGSWGQVFPTFVSGFAGKYRAGYGTPFDLAVLAEAHAAARTGEGGFSPQFRTQLLENYPFLDLHQIRYVRLVDIIGDGSFKDCEGFSIYDPYPTLITAGFDLDALGVMKQGTVSTKSFSDWSNEYALPVVAGADTDRDGWSQYLEYRLGSSPVDRLSTPAIVQQVNQDNVYRIAFKIDPATSGRIVLQSSRDGNNWQDRSVTDFRVDGTTVGKELLIDLGSETSNPLFLRIIGETD